MAVNVQKAEFVLSAVSPKNFLEDGLPQVAFAGRSNVGKSSVINRLLNRKNFARVGAAPGKTIHINYFKIDGAFYLVDLPGYGYAKAAPEIRETWSRLIGGYLADRPSLTGIVIVMDARRPFMPADEWLIDFFSSRSHVRQLWLINKCDQIKRAERNTVLAKARARAQQLGDHVEVQLFSGLKKEGVEELQQRLLTWIDPEGRLSADTPSA